MTIMRLVLLCHLPLSKVSGVHLMQK
jgi:hypothetical protein